MQAARLLSFLNNNKINTEIHESSFFFLSVYGKKIYGNASLYEQRQLLPLSLFKTEK